MYPMKQIKFGITPYGYAEWQGKWTNYIKPVIVEEVNFVSFLFPQIEIPFININQGCHAKD